MASLPHIPVLRAGADYESLDQAELAGPDGVARARVSRANAGLIRRDLARAAAGARALRELSTERLLAISARAGELFLDGELPLNEAGDLQSAAAYVEALSATSGLPHALVRANMRKIHTVLTGMESVLCGLTRGLDPKVLERGVGEQNGVALSYAPLTDVLAVVLPSNSPGVNSIWLPAVALRTAVMLKPGREEPWTPLRILRAFLAAGAPREAFGFYPTDHEGAAALLEGAGRSVLFGDEATAAAYAHDPRVEVHGPGRSKIVFGPDEAERWEQHLDVLVASVADNGGRSCVNASSIFTPAHADEIAEALAQRLAEIAPLPPDDPRARLAAFADARVAAHLDGLVERAVREGSARDVSRAKRAQSGVHSAAYSNGERLVEAFGGRYLLPTIVRCPSPKVPLARTEMPFPFAAVVEVSPKDLVASLGPSLVVTAITRDPKLVDELLRAGGVRRLNLGPVPTSRVEWDQPHEGNLFETLWERRAIQRAERW